MLKRFIPALALVALLGACARYDRLTARVGDSFNSATLYPQYREATSAFDRGEYGLAVGHIQNLLPRMPESPRREELLFKEGVAFLELKNYQEARDTFAAYKTRYPQGAYVNEADQNLVRITAEQSDRAKVSGDRLLAAQKDLGDLQKIEKEFPADPKVKYALGNLYYEVAKYEQAGQKYYEAQAIEAAYKEKELISERLFINEQGKPEARSPEAMRQIESANDPLAVIDVNPYNTRGNTDAFGARQIYAIATGKVWNRGKEALRNVELEVRFTGALNTILDFQTIQIGTLRPGEVRPFLARATDYDHIGNITDVQVMKRFDRMGQ